MPLGRTDPVPIILKYDVMGMGRMEMEVNALLNALYYIVYYLFIYCSMYLDISCFLPVSIGLFGCNSQLKRQLSLLLMKS